MPARISSRADSIGECSAGVYHYRGTSEPGVGFKLQLVIMVLLFIESRKAIFIQNRLIELFPMRGQKGSVNLNSN